MDAPTEALVETLVSKCEQLQARVTELEAEANDLARTANRCRQGLEQAHLQAHPRAGR